MACFATRSCLFIGPHKDSRSFLVCFLWCCTRLRPTRLDPEPFRCQAPQGSAVTWSPGAAFVARAEAFEEPQRPTFSETSVESRENAECTGLPANIDLLKAKRLTYVALPSRSTWKAMRTSLSAHCASSFGSERSLSLRLCMASQQELVLQSIDLEDWPRIQQLVAEVHDLRGRLQRITELLPGAAARSQRLATQPRWALLKE